MAEKTQAVIDANSSSIQHYTDLEQVPWDIQKYYHQRYSIFSKYDEGIWMTDDAWFEVTPEPIANKIADHIAEASPNAKHVLIDCFAGVGGNVIAFATSDRWKTIHAIEKDPDILACAKHNAEIYGVNDRITWHQGNCFELLQKELQDVCEQSVLFSSPPWGGQGYRLDKVFDLSRMRPYSIRDLLTQFTAVSKDFVLYLPRTSDIRQLVENNDQDKITVIHYCIKGASKALCAYYGIFTFKNLK